ncbi:MAG: hypothetical protein KatS3mg111_2193 [Pirellulaceae bacterium]|nr:MAG: hypothetical protein KatS3mg111_2193 [Pirellulaceae bacterium]
MLVASSNSESPNLPLRHVSCARFFAPVRCEANYPLEEETPLFAADPHFALSQGGPLTRRFLKAAIIDWHQRIVVDSSLVWLSPGLSHELTPIGPLIGPRTKVGFVHEPFPGITSGVCGNANRNLRAVHRLGIFGLNCTPELAEGEVAFSSLEEAEAFWLPTDSFEFREREVARRIKEGSLRCRKLPLATVIEFGWGTLLRSCAANSHGFQLIIRVTSGDERPYVNGLRNYAQL